MGGADTLTGGDGLDTVEYRASSAGVTVNLATSTVSGGDAAGDRISSIENVSGSDADDTIIGSAASNVLNGNDGRDTIEGGAGADRMDGGNGRSDTLSYATSSALGVVMSLDGLLVAEGDAVGDVVFNFETFGARTPVPTRCAAVLATMFFRVLAATTRCRVVKLPNSLDGGEGFDFADYSRDGAIRIDLAAGTAAGKATGDTFISIEGFISGEGDTIMRGDDADNHFTATSRNQRPAGARRR